MCGDVWESDPIFQGTAIGTALCHRRFHSVTDSWCDHFVCAAGRIPFCQFGVEVGVGWGAYLDWGGGWLSTILSKFEVGTHLHLWQWFNSLRPRQSGRHCTDDIFKCIFLNENVWIVLKISLEFVPKVRINNIPALVQIMAWRRQGDKPLSEPMMVSLLTHICVTRPQWVKTGLAVSDKGRYIPWYKQSRHKQVSDTQNVQNCHKQVLNNKTVWNCVSNNLQYIINVKKMLKKTFFSFFTSIKSLYCSIINVWALDQWYTILFQLFYHIYESLSSFS